MQSRTNTRGSFRLHQSLFLMTMNCTFLSFGVPAKPGIAKDLNVADYNDRKAVAGFID